MTPSLKESVVNFTTDESCLLLGNEPIPQPPAWNNLPECNPHGIGVKITIRYTYNIHHILYILYLYMRTNDKYDELKISFGAFKNCFHGQIHGAFPGLRGKQTLPVRGTSRGFTDH